jgi:hypothetical protein
MGGENKEDVLFVFRTLQTLFFKKFVKRNPARSEERREVK